MVNKRLIILLVAIAAVTPAAVFAQMDPLLRVYASRADLQSAFDPVTHRAVAGTAAGFLLDLEDWARQYGWAEHAELRSYGPEQGDGVPVRIDLSEIEQQIGAHAYVVMDRSTGKILTVKQENRVWPIASLTKLVTADVVLDASVPMSRTADIRNSDNVGGARLYVNDGDTMSVGDLFFATLVASANNAANALSRATGLNREDFLSRMNDRARSLNLSRTDFVDPTGIELGNVSTAREMARLALYVFARDEVRRFTTTQTAYVDVLNRGTSKKMINTNWMLYKPAYDDVYVTGGKTGYLIESGWNVVVTLRPNSTDTDRELLLVVFGAGSRVESFNDTKRLAEWAWQTHEWQRQR
jgi:serine-type D-Ala-D-Ala endopeptidase (penicillin-binding protein 7)